MHVCALMGSPRKDGNTNMLLNPFLAELGRKGCGHDLFWLHDLSLEPCVACRACQQDWTVFGCPVEDDLHPIFDCVLASDLIVLATPIYSFFCTPPMKAVLDRLVYGMNKYYGDKKGPSLWAGKRVAIITTCGYKPEKGADLFEEGIKRYCKHSQLRYAGMLAERHRGYDTVFWSDDKGERAAAFAAGLVEA